ncbi:hypothetical protein LHV13_07650 [Ferrovum sp. PN-J185]|uniref:hypothetical protein n=1 Tax=Ferrovum sp. PN-J185 TaxID=1356306 RepID=UPI000796DC42|nr:hypothetical protein [Ferrovum sp. PN-J185]KXW56319.1 hypothetical protein FV185_02670 [Ferrovum sp. PN-J185]MCC6069043.1 hypothetical protein [Ferrovum sp. PN-J185]MDE1890977.1 hypothetical protein [Betaproteobacteria bacterium]MDE2055711.1 hypothetical protein [Betaproteobacteria bacterium]
MTQSLKQLSLLCALLFFYQYSNAFWLLGFSDANTLSPGSLGVIAGTGAQFARVGNPQSNSFTGAIPHAGIRYGLNEDTDIGYRLVQVALPFTSVGPTLGSEVDLKKRLTNVNDPYQIALVGGVAYSYLDISGTSKSAYSPGADLILSHAISPKYTWFTELREVYTAIPTAVGSTGSNHFNALGIASGGKIKLTDSTSFVPEIGYFHFNGLLNNQSANGNAIQIGAIFAIKIW